MTIPQNKAFPFCPTALFWDNTSLFNIQQLAAFWKVEVLAPKLLNTEEAQCEELFLKTTSRDNIGRFIVRLPFKENIYNLGDSYNIAKRRFLHLENKLKFDMQLKNAYPKFMDDYISLGHKSLSTGS
ncbi:hypothetical protein NQ315_000047 [Exocentrus adspersus]|uniref:LAGLIDADG homing endonuclease n=1 Tax=Exocentrus adspersus TaxID=1586481 RepID=A0AAV8VFJ3_9CUCU|nr:hypothetical protein NQ315_000047 [Exocentrus adspersus]